MTDISELYEQFSQFSPTAVIGIGHEMQPVYRHMLSKYRQSHPDTRIGMPPPDGMTGFNSGVLLLDLEKMRKSKLYNSLLNADAVQKLTEKFMMKGMNTTSSGYSKLDLNTNILNCKHESICEFLVSILSYVL